ncbi:hypothetical protein [Amycolatopsis sp. RTGN1]|uniref:hypothetical protein n=1 Tax=Amycolatopsis ponsaeliensis TaxID=2992142 RepID=UPI00254CD4BB|nr:hypothetical protein [Amycolatopsis sp. RTGN1]
MRSERELHLSEFYASLVMLADRLDGTRSLSNCTGRDGWPTHGVYFFFEHGELRTNGEPRVVRVGTHALRDTSRTTLWNRLAQHRGTQAGGGNHRGSIFRQHVGSALIDRDGMPAGSLEAWVSPRPRPEWATVEADIERRVSDYIGRMPFLWLAVPTSTSQRAYIERNSIGLLSNLPDVRDRPSSTWLGRHAASLKVRACGLWNVNHVEEGYEPEFLTALGALVEGTAAPG